MTKWIKCSFPRLHRYQQSDCNKCYRRFHQTLSSSSCILPPPRFRLMIIFSPFRDHLTCGQLCLMHQTSKTTCSTVSDISFDLLQINPNDKTNWKYNQTQNWFEWLTVIFVKQPNQGLKLYFLDLITVLLAIYQCLLKSQKWIRRSSLFIMYSSINDF